MNNDFKDFVENHSQVPEGLYRETLELSLIGLRPEKILIKFFGLNILGALLTLSICPQYGFGPYTGIMAFTNVIMSYGPVICGIFCASVFFAGGHLLSFAFLKKSERKWVLRHNYALMIPYISFIFMLGMTLKFASPGHIHHDVSSFYVGWLFGAVAVSILITKSVENLTSNASH